MTDYLTVGGSGGHLSPSYFDRVYIPNFPEEKQLEIAKQYHTPDVTYDASVLTLDNFLEKDDEYNESAGITELDRVSKILKARLNYVIDQIIKDEEVQTDFTFLLSS